MDKKRTIVLAVLCAIGLILTGELAYVFYKANFLASTTPSFCTINSTIDCDGVAKTSYALFLGVPLALWGTLLYLTVLFLVSLDYLKQKFTNFNNFFFDVFKNPRSYIATLGLISFVISMLLAAVSIFKIGKICALCFVTYFINLIVAFVAKTPGSPNFFFAVDIKNTFNDFIDGAKKHAKLFILAIILAIALLTYTTVSNVFAPHMQKSAVQSLEDDAKKDSIQKFRDMATNPYGVSGNQLGKKGAKIQLYIYSDFMCPFCRLTNIMLHKLASEDPDVEIHHMNFPLDVECNPLLVQSMHPGACGMAKYAIASRKQGNYWGMVNALYNELPKNEAEVLEVAQKIGLDKDQLYKDAHSQETAEILATQLKIAKNNYIQGTPSMAINGIVYAGGMSYEEIQKLVEQAKVRWERDSNDLFNTLESIGEAK